MKLIFVRHGDPNYKDNCLTPLGHVQAEAVAPKIAEMEPDALYSSTYGRAMETAEHTAAFLGMPVTPLDFIHEISSGLDGLDREERLKYSPWLSTQKMLAEGEDILHYDFSEHFAWKGTHFEESYARVTEGFDAWMRTLGYEREKTYYRCTRKNDDKLVVFAHGGSISCVLAHVTGLSPQFVCGYIHLSCTGITVLRFEGEEGEIAVPKILKINEDSHIKNLSVHDEVPKE